MVLISVNVSSDYVKINENTKIIINSAFENRNKLKEVKIPNGVTSNIEEVLSQMDPKDQATIRKVLSGEITEEDSSHAGSSAWEYFFPFATGTAELCSCNWQ